MTSPRPRPGPARPGRRPAGARARPRPGAVLVDATLGLGGHTEAVLDPLRAGPRGRHRPRPRTRSTLAGERLAPFGDRFTGVHAVYDELPDVLADLGLDAVDAVLFDLGVSSMQLDLRERGFAYAEDAPLDMRMDGTTGPTAADVLNTYPADELARVLREYGEERFARRIAAAVVARARAGSRSPRSARLVELLYAEIPAPARRTGGHPAKRTFQALRMEVNDELAVLRRAMPAAIDAIAGRRPGGRRVLPLARGPAGQAGVHRRHRSRRAAGPAVRARGPRAGAAAASPAAPSRPTQRRDRREPPRRLGAAARHRTSQRTEPSQRSRMSMSTAAAAPAPTARLPRLAEAAVERARLTVVPRRGGSGPPGCRS